MEFCVGYAYSYIMWSSVEGMCIVTVCYVELSGGYAYIVMVRLVLCGV